MNLEELLDFCKKNGVSITIESNTDADAVVVALQRRTDNCQNRLLVQRECCASASDKKTHFQFVLNYMIAEMENSK